MICSGRCRAGGDTSTPRSSDFSCRDFLLCPGVLSPVSIANRIPAGIAHEEHTVGHVAPVTGKRAARPDLRSGVPSQTWSSGSAAHVRQGQGAISSRTVKPRAAVSSGQPRCVVLPVEDDGSILVRVRDAGRSTRIIRPHIGAYQLQSLEGRGRPAGGLMAPARLHKKKGDETFRDDSRTSEYAPEVAVRSDRDRQSGFGHPLATGHDTT